MWLSAQRDPLGRSYRWPQLQFASFCVLLTSLIGLNPQERLNLLVYVVHTSPFQDVVNSRSLERLGKTVSPPKRGGLFRQPSGIVHLA